jgi:hypothetical protein
MEITMETLKRRLELATEMYKQLPATQKEGFGRRLHRLTTEVAEVEALPADEREPRRAALIRLIEELDHDLAEHTHPMHIHV